MPDDLAGRSAGPRACEALGVPIITHERYEADDVIGTLASAALPRATRRHRHGDKDFFQLVSDGIRVFNPRDDGTWYDAAV
jgi:DNA polymerase-1